MTRPSRDEPADLTVGKLRIIGFALLAGPALFGIVIGVMMSLDLAPVGQGEGAPPLAEDMSQLLTWVGVGAVAVAIPVAFLVRGKSWAKIRSTAEPKQMAVFSTGAITFMAILEAPTLLNLVCWMLTGDVTSPLAAAVPWAISAANLPSQYIFDDLAGQ